MLSSILSKSDCASCKFCCSFKRSSLWETPVFEKALAEKLKLLYKDVKFHPLAGSSSSFTYDISSSYKTDNAEEEATCPAINRQPLQKVRDLAEQGLGKVILDYGISIEK